MIVRFAVDIATAYQVTAAACIHEHVLFATLLEQHRRRAFVSGKVGNAMALTIAGIHIIV